MRLRRRNMAELADRHYLYQESVQDTQSEIDFVEETWAELRDRPAELLREDFCGTANTACEWVRRDRAHRAVGIDLDGEVLEWGELNNIAQLDADQQARIELLQEDVVETLPEPADHAGGTESICHSTINRGVIFGWACATTAVR